MNFPFIFQMSMPLLFTMSTMFQFLSETKQDTGKGKELVHITDHWKHIHVNVICVCVYLSVYVCLSYICIHKYIHKYVYIFMYIYIDIFIYCLNCVFKSQVESNLLWTNSFFCNQQGRKLCIFCKLLWLLFTFHFFIIH